MPQFLALVAWFVAVIMLIVVPIEHRRQKQFGEDGRRVMAAVVEHAQGVARTFQPGEYHVAVRVSFVDDAGAAREAWVYEWDRDVPDVGAEVDLVYPEGRPEQARPPIPRVERWKSALTWTAWALVVALGGAGMWMGAQPGAAPWLRFLPMGSLCAGLILLGVATWSVSRYDGMAIQKRYVPVEGTVVAVERCGTRSLGGGRSMPLYCATIAYDVEGVRWTTQSRAHLSTPRVGEVRTVRYAPERPELAEIDEDRTAERVSGIGVALALAGLIGLVLVGQAWVRAARAPVPPADAAVSGGLEPR